MAQSLQLRQELLTYSASAGHGDKPTITPRITAPLVLSESTHGIIFAIAGLPNQDIRPTHENPQGIQAIGGMGESYIASLLASILSKGERNPIEFGAANRKYFIDNVYQQDPNYSGSDVEALYEKWRKESYSPELDKKLDALIRTMAVETAQEQRFAVVSSKIFPLLYLAAQAENPNLAWPALVTIGIDADNDIALVRATYRRLKKQYPNYHDFVATLESMPELQQLELLLETVEARQNRYRTEHNNLGSAYPDAVGNYSRQTMLGVTDIIFDNSHDYRDERHLKRALYHLLAEVAIQAPQLASTLLPPLPYFVTEVMRVRELRHLMLQEPSIQNFERAWIVWLEKDLTHEHIHAEFPDLRKLEKVTMKPINAFTSKEISTYPFLQVKSFYRSFHLEDLLKNGWIEQNFDTPEGRRKAEHFMKQMILLAQDELV